MDKLRAEDLVEDIIGDLEKRSGFDSWWDDIDADIKEEIYTTLVGIARDY